MRSHLTFYDKRSPHPLRNATSPDRMTLVFSARRVPFPSTTLGKGTSDCRSPERLLACYPRSPATSATVHRSCGFEALFATATVGLCCGLKKCCFVQHWRGLWRCGVSGGRGRAIPRPRILKVRPSIAFRGSVLRPNRLWVDTVFLKLPRKTVNGQSFPVVAVGPFATLDLAKATHQKCRRNRRFFSAH